MPFVRDFFHTSPPSHLPLARVTSEDARVLPCDDATQPGPSSHPLDQPVDRQDPAPDPLVDPPAPPYEDEEFSACAARRSTDRSMLYPTRSVEPPAGYPPSAPSVCSTATNTPLPSRSPSPLPFYYSGASSSDSDTESEPESPLLAPGQRRPAWQNGERRRWWSLSVPSPNTDGWRRRRRWRDVIWGLRSCKRILRRLVRHPLFPKTPFTILLTLLFLTIFGVSLTFLLIYILNPDKDPLPWRGYCTLPQHSGGPPSLSLSPTALLQTPLPTNFTPPVFPPADLDSMAPAGVFVGVFSMDTAVERRMYVRSTWANHVRSREGAGDGDGGIGTSRTVVRFILGQPRKDWERRVQLEMDTYNDMVILPVQENMNGGKTHAFFSWAANHSWVPPLYQDDFTTMPGEFSYTNATSPAPVLASHDPALAHRDQLVNAPPRPWVRPDFVVKADDDSFVMLAELEARLRVELYKDPLPPPPPPSDRKQHPSQQSQLRPRVDEGPAILDFNQIASYFDFAIASTPSAPPAAPPEPPSRDPLVFWGYLVKNRFMAGELYALSFALVDWVSKDPLVKTMTRGAEDKQTSKWIRAHPRADQVRWSSERCWIYDHPRAGTVYSHGFLFPSEVKRVQEGVLRDLERLAQQLAKESSSTTALAVSSGQNVAAPDKWSHSTVSKFGSRYSPPSGDLNLEYSVEALVEGSDMSLVNDDSSLTADLAWKYREGRRKRYAGQRVGGTVVVHFIKKNMWFLETAAALLHGEDVTPLERALEHARAVEPDDAEPEQGGGDVVGADDGREGVQDSSSSPGQGTESDFAGAASARTMVRRRRDPARGSSR